MGNSESKENTSVNYDKKNCVDSGVWEDTGCEGIMEAGEDVTEIKNCKIVCLNHWISKLTKQKEKLKVSVDNLERKLKRLSESAENAANSSLNT
jgi:hypothetical protein